MEKIKHYKFIIILLILDLLALLYGISTLSISFDEAKIYFYEHSLLSYLAHFGTFIFGQNDFGLRIPFLFFHFLSCILLYLLAKKYTKTDLDAFLSLLVFILLPGTVASALLVNEASVVIFLSLAILYCYEYGKQTLCYILLVLALFVDKSFSILFLTFFFFALYKKEPTFFIINLVLFGLSMSFYGFDTGGKPKGYFLDTLGIFAACFSPLVFIYFFYVIYRSLFKSEKTLLWFLMSVTFVFCSLLSMRQKLYLEDFLPFCVICTPLLIKTLMASYRVRLPKFRLKYKIFIECSMIFLLLCYLIIIFNPLLYYVTKSKNSHFANNYHEAKELAQKLKERGIFQISTNEELELRLKFYGIEKGEKLALVPSKNNKRSKNQITIQLGKFTQIYQIQSRL